MASHQQNIFTAAAGDDVKGIDEALQSGIGINAQDENGMAALHHAAVHASMNAIDRILTEPNLDGTLTDNFGRNASYAAIEVLGVLGMPVAERLRPYCYPTVFREMEERLEPKS